MQMDLKTFYITHFIAQIEINETATKFNSCSALA